MAKYSPIEFDFKHLTMTFYRGKEPVKLKGEIVELMLKLIKRSKLVKWRKKQTYGITAQLYMVEDDKEAVRPPKIFLFSWHLIWAFGSNFGAFFYLWIFWGIL